MTDPAASTPPGAPATPAAPRRFVLYGFGSAHGCLAAERLLTEAGLAVRAIPKPLSLGEECSIVLRVEPGDAALAEKLLAESGATFTPKGEFHDL